MKFQQLGTDGPAVSVIGFGCWQMGNRGYGTSDDRQMIAAVHHAIDAGITLFDTAPTYGAGGSEELLGRALQGRRDEVFLVSKVGITLDPATAAERYDGRPEVLRRINDESLARLRTDHLDLVLLHWPDPDTPIAETMAALEDLRAGGKVRHIGVCNHAAHELRAACRVTDIRAIQVGFNLFDRRWEREMFPTAVELGVGVMAYGPLAHGLLTGAVSRGHVFGDGDWRRGNDIFGQSLFGENLERNLDVVEALANLARELGTRLPALAIAWVMADPAVAVTLVGCSRPEEVTQNLGALEVTLDVEAMAVIEAIMAGAAGLSDGIPGRHHPA